MVRKRLIAAAMIAVLGAAGFLAWRLTHPHRSDRDLINELFDRIERGIETKQPRMVRDAFSADYGDDFGFTKRDLHRLSLELLRIHGALQVVIDELEIEVHGREADASLRGEVTLQEAGAETREFAGALTFHLRKQRGHWLITSTAGWQATVEREYEL